MIHNPYNEFQETGLIVFVNQILHIFGWALVFTMEDNGQITSIIPMKVDYRGFNREVEEAAYEKVTAYMRDNAKRLDEEVNGPIYQKDKMNNTKDPHEISVKKVMLAPELGLVSCVGIHDKNYPISFGNYCSLADGPYLCNFWAENLDEWVRRNPDVKEIEITVVEHMGRNIGFVSDERMKDWCNKRTCVTGCGWPSVAVMRLVCDTLGLPRSECCGCEKDTESTYISRMWNMKETQYTCHRCKRQWRKDNQADKKYYSRANTRNKGQAADLS